VNPGVPPKRQVAGRKEAILGKRVAVALFAALVGAGAASAAAVVILRLFFVNVSVVPQGGMYPTIRPGSLLLSWKRPYGRIADVRRGDIVLFNRIQEGKTYLYVWRVVGLPGDRIAAEKDMLTLNGAPVRRQALRDEGGLQVFRETVGAASYDVAIAKAPSDIPPAVALTVAPNELFVLGDNRYDAVDSRYFGPIKFARIVGRGIR
jgi:signal peptidase I